MIDENRERRMHECTDKIVKIMSNADYLFYKNMSRFLEYDADDNLYKSEGFVAELPSMLDDVANLRNKFEEIEKILKNF